MARTPIGWPDTMVAAHALNQQALPVTNNTREFAQLFDVTLGLRAIREIDHA